MPSDARERRAVRQYLSSGEQPSDGYRLATKIYPQRTYVTARDLEGELIWAFHVNPAGSLFRADGVTLIALDNPNSPRPTLGDA